MSKTSSIFNFWPKMFLLGEIEKIGNLAGVKDLTNSRSISEFAYRTVYKVDLVPSDLCSPISTFGTW